MLAGGLLSLVGCAPQADPNAVASFRHAVGSGNFQAASNIATQQALPAADGRGTELQWSLNAGAAALHAQDHQRSIAMLDGAEDLMRRSEEAGFNWGGTYRFGTYDAVMVNAYKAFAMLGRNDRENARVELNRMEERQERTVQRFRREIGEAIASAEQQRNANPGNAQALTSAQNSPEIREQMREHQRLASYAPFVNPTGTYIRGIFLLNSEVPGDADQARIALQRVAGISRNNPVVAQDVASAQAAASGRRPSPQVWVLFENGQSPVFEQMNFTIPMPVYAGRGVGVAPITVSMPRIAPMPIAYPALQVSGGDARANTAQVADIQGVTVSEFGTRYNSLLAATVFEAVAKAALVSGTNAAARQVGGVGGALMATGGLVAANITRSDTRSWYALPRELQVARIPVPANGALSLRAVGGPAEAVTVPSGRSSIVLVKAQAPGSPLTVRVYPL